jgi:hypothetical protein
MTHDWLPAVELVLVQLMLTWDLWLSDVAKRTLYGWDAAECTKVIIAIGNFFVVRDEYLADNSSVKRLVKNQKKAIAVALMRDFANSSIRYNKKMPDADKLVLGVPVRDPHHTPQADPTDLVDFQFESLPSDHRLIMPYRIAGASSHGKDRYHGVEVRIWILPLDAPGPLSAEHPGWRSEISTATPWKHTFAEAEIGMRLHVVMRWENGSVSKDRSSGKGPWSGFQSVVIA